MPSRTRKESPEEQFVTNAAHELQSPLTAIVSAVEVLQAGAKDTPERDIFLDHIEQAAARLVRLTRALLVLSRVQTRLEAPRTELVELEPLLSDVAAHARAQEHVDLAVSCPAGAAVVVALAVSEVEPGRQVKIRRRLGVSPGPVGSYGPTMIASTPGTARMSA
jgi:signal transduction histidine kinase